MIEFSPAEVTSYYAVRLPDLPLRGKEARISCPVHHGKDRNFSVNLEDGRSFCNSQCGRGWDIVGLEMELTGAEFAKAKAEVFQIVGRVNGNGTNGASRHKEPCDAPRAPRTTATWVREQLEHDGFRYNSHADFGDFARSVRFEHVEEIQAGKARPAKTYRWEHRVDLDGVWYSGAGERAIPLFFNATARRAGGGPFVVLVEGWNKSNALDALGIPSASLKELTAENADQLADFRRIVIWPDADEAGRKYAATAAELLGRKGLAVSVIDPPAELGEGGDVIDLIALGWDRERIEGLLTPPPLAGGPRERLDALLKVFQKWLHLPDPGALRVVLGSAVANMMSGDPIWLLIVGAPGGGKTEMLQTLATLKGFHPAATFTEASLLSGTPKREQGATATGGLLRVIGEHGTILLKDFGSVLSMPRDPRAALMAALREVFDGSWTRQLGTDGGRTLTWAGKCGLLAGVTPAIDSHHSVMASLGERFLLYRLPVADPKLLAAAALKHVGAEKTMRAELSSAVKDWFQAVDLPTDPIPPDEAEVEFLIALATLTVKARSGVERDYRTRDIDFVPDSEVPGRFVRCLAQLLAGVKVIGVPADERRALIRKAALDSIPALRRRALEMLSAAMAPIKTSDVAKDLDHPTVTVRRSLEELAAHGVVRRLSGGSGNADLWELTDWAATIWRAIA